MTGADGGEVSAGRSRDAPESTRERRRDSARPAVPGDPVDNVIARVRITVVLTIMSLLVLGVPPSVRDHLPVSLTLAVVALIYAVAAWLGPPQLFGPTSMRSNTLTLFDAALTLLFIAFTGPATSPFVAILFLTTITAAMRFGILPAVIAAVIEGGVYALLVLTVRQPPLAFHTVIEVATWWPLYLVFTAVLTGVLAQLRSAELSGRIGAELRETHERDHLREIQVAANQYETLLAVVVHEFRTPVVSLKALASHLSSGGSHRDDESKMTEALQLIRAHAEHLNDMVDEVQEISRSKRPGAEWPTFSGDVFLEDLVVAAAVAAGSTGDNVRITVESSAQIVQVPASSLRRILTNLIENALHYNSSEHPVLVDAAVAEQTLIVSVCDNGSRQAFENWSDVTGPFATGDHRPSGGLGLWVVDQLVTRLGGSIAPITRPEGGLEMRVVIPLSLAHGERTPIR